MRNLLGRFTTDSLAAIEKFFCRVTGWDAEAASLRSGRKPKAWYRERFERMLESGKRLLPLKSGGCDFELRGWLEEGGGKSGVNVGTDSERFSRVEQESGAEGAEEVELLCEDEGVETVSEAKALTEAEGTFEADEASNIEKEVEDEDAAKVEWVSVSRGELTEHGAGRSREAELEKKLAETMTHLVGAVAEAATAQERIAELQMESEVVRSCLEGRVLWLEEELAETRPSLIAEESNLPMGSSREAIASLLAAVSKGKEELGRAEAQRQTAEMRLLEREKELARAEASRKSAGVRLQEQESRSEVAERGQALAEDKLDELETEQCALIKRLMAAREGCLATSLRAAAAEKRVAELTRERSELLEGLQPAEEECAATSMRRE